MHPLIPYSLVCGTYLFAIDNKTPVQRQKWLLNLLGCKPGSPNRLTAPLSTLTPSGLVECMVNGWGGICKVLSNWHMPRTCVLTCFGALRDTCLTSRKSQEVGIHLSDHWCHCSLPKGLRMRGVCVRACACVCVRIKTESKFVTPYLFIGKLLTSVFFLVPPVQERGKKPGGLCMCFRHNLLRANVCAPGRACVCVCVATCWVASPRGQIEGGWHWCDVLACALGWFWCGCHFVVFAQLPLRHTPYYSNTTL